MVDSPHTSAGTRRSALTGQGSAVDGPGLGALSAEARWSIARTRRQTLGGRPSPAKARRSTGRDSARYRPRLGGRCAHTSAGTRRSALGGQGSVVGTQRSTAGARRSTVGGPQGGGRLTAFHQRGLLRTVTDTCVRLWRRVHMDLLRYAGCVCRPSC
ncbi:putative leader peptide [Streptomyces sp. NPDC048566]|uniref:putative leader peptide n=1 Tax=Streptomyces sp. NPDC048566 TaxID=3365569 RepID=UPI00371CF04C